MAAKAYRYVGKAYAVPDRDGTVDLRIVQLTSDSSIHIEWSSRDYSDVLERWKKFKRKSPKPTTAAEARTIIKDFQKAEAKRSGTTNTGRVPG